MSGAKITRLVYRPLGESGAYPEWLRAVGEKSGVYFIRDKATKQLLYIGESHSDDLTDTCTRHFSRWRRLKKWWVGKYRDTSHDPGVRYDRGEVEVAIRVMQADRAIAAQFRRIQSMRPRDNMVDGDGKKEDPPKGRRADGTEEEY